MTKHRSGRSFNVAGSTWWSVSAHLLVIALLLGHLKHTGAVRAVLPGTAAGDRIELSYLPGGRRATVLQTTSRIAPVSSRRPAVKKDRPAAAAPTTAIPTTGQEGHAGNDALGTEDIQIALTTYSPSPKPDLSRLPHGMQGDVVLNITIDPTGKVADLQILNALGYGVEGKVAETVRTWTFRPAMKDGTPVASIQELHFHYGPV